MAAKKTGSKKRRAVIVGGVRTPFLRAFSDFTKMSSYQLGAVAVKGLLEKYPVTWDAIDSCIWGAVIVGGSQVNVGREIVLELKLPPSIEAYTVSRACTSGLLSVTLAVSAIERGDGDVIIAGGSDSTSNAQVTMPQSLVHKAAPVVMSRKSTFKDYLSLAGKLNIKKDLIPKQPSIKERTTGELMGESCEKMARRNEISREEQDDFSAQSHRRAARAVENGRLAKEIVPVITPEGKTIYADNIVRPDVTVEKLGKLRAAFANDGKGTLTAGNSSALTDGASAVLVMSQKKAEEFGLKPLAFFRSWSYDAVDPADQLLIGPAISMPKALIKAGALLEDMDIVDIHEAFAAQVLSVLKVMKSRRFAKERLELEKAIGEISPKEINLYGGSLAFGHPFGATGARMVTTMANELGDTKKKTALLGICAQGGQSAGAVMESVE